MSSPFRQAPFMALRARSRSAIHPSGGLSLRQRHLSTKPTEPTNVDLVGPNDPVSNIRPVRYAQSPTHASSSTSPYSTSEFTNVSSPDTALADERIGEDLEWRLRRERVDAKNHEFWTHLDHRLKTRLPPAPGPEAPPEVVSAHNEARDQVLTDFYRDWLEANKARQSRWVWEWWGDIRHEVWDGLKRSLRWR
ncbi:hypothetical protein NCC49_001234 [Naganishia albida]|nr:hypothetical protein NCC49_001234 [Naganishia albida]